MTASGSKAGFALPAVLAVVAVVTLVFLVTIDALSSLNREARMAVDEAAFEERVLTAQARVAYYAVTEPTGADSLAIGARRLSVTEAAGLGPLASPAATPGEQAATTINKLRLDGSAWRLQGGDTERPVVVTLQDGAGLLNVNFMTFDQRRRLFAELGLSEPDQRRMAARLGDYIDTDSLLLTDGGEAEAYARAKLAPPANAPLRTIDELPGLLGWRELVDSRRWNALRPALTADATGGTSNVNTSPEAVLRIRYAMSPAQIETARSLRDLRPFFSLTDFASAVGLALESDPLQVSTLANRRVVVTVTDPALRLTARARITPTSDHRDRPFWVEETSLGPSTAEQARLTADDAQPLPDPAY